MRSLIASALILGAFVTGAHAQESTVNGAAGGAVTGAIVGGPVGAAVGGVVGAVAGTAIDPPPQRVVTYVQEQPIPTDTVVYEGPVTVGKTISREVVLTPVPEAPQYSYTIVNQQRVIVDPNTYTVVQVVQ
jgi:hypothetical protein